MKFSKHYIFLILHFLLSQTFQKIKKSPKFPKLTKKMFRVALPVFVILNALLLPCVHPFQVSPVDTNLLTGFFDKAAAPNSDLRVVKPEFVSAAASDELSIERTSETSSFFEEQCLIECLRSPSCVKYAFNEDTRSCKLTVNKAKLRTLNNAEHLASNIMCDDQRCANSLYCSPQVTSSNGQCVCDSSSTWGASCANKVQFDLSEWSGWNSCTVNCDTGNCYCVFYNSQDIFPHIL